MSIVNFVDSGTTLDAQARYAAGVREVLRRTFDNEELNPTDVIVQVFLSFSFCMRPQNTELCSIQDIQYSQNTF